MDGLTCVGVYRVKEVENVCINTGERRVETERERVVYCVYGKRKETERKRFV